ncbi:hypothetical protein DYB37_008297 [Aphanomyces astaci]|uniref:ubiquitinyl hydrolase 1 n=1 Tax=Aphanomyces astaci TaxID=112090 RepID=A0A418EPA0_APHAT|nr:hypothetical protein DYB37_008297 [Aphanomyces astaci]
MNAALQCLSHTTALTVHFLTNAYQTDLNSDNVLGTGGKLATQYALLLKHDAQELLAFLLDGLHEDVNRITNKPYVEAVDSNGTEPDAAVAATAWQNHLLRNASVFVDTLHGQFKSTVVCPHCAKVSITFDPFNCVQLELPHAVTRPLEPQTYGVHVHKRSHVKAIKATKTMQLYSLPEVLILSLKRFEYRNEVVRDKLDALVEFPLEGLDMAPFCLSTPSTGLIYDLYATTNHVGSMGFGHYTAFAQDQQTRLWYHFDDSSVTSVAASSVVSNAAYILFYKRRGTSSNTSSRPAPRL